MTGLLRYVGILTAAIWLGGAIFFSFVAGQIPFSPDMKALLEKLGPTNANFAAYLGGAIAQIGIARYFKFQLICCIIALAHLGVDEVLVDGGELVLEDLVEVRDDFDVAFHSGGSLRVVGWR